VVPRIGRRVRRTGEFAAGAPAKNRRGRTHGGQARSGPGRCRLPVGLSGLASPANAGRQTPGRCCPPVPNRAHVAREGLGRAPERVRITAAAAMPAPSPGCPPGPPGGVPTMPRPPRRGRDLRDGCGQRCGQPARNPRFPRGIQASRTDCKSAIVGSTPTGASSPSTPACPRFSRGSQGFFVAPGGRRRGGRHRHGGRVLPSGASGALRWRHSPPPGNRSPADGRCRWALGDFPARGSTPPSVRPRPPLPVLPIPGGPAGTVPGVSDRAEPGAFSPCHSPRRVSPRCR